MEAEATAETATEPRATGEGLDEVEIELAAVEAALARLDEGTYATCEVCRAALDDILLEASPTARRCPAHP